MTISLDDDNHISEPIGNIHENVQTYILFDPDGFEWGETDFCNECKNRYIGKDWKCIPIENK